MLLERFTDFEVGDEVRIRSWDDMENEYGLCGDESIDCVYKFTKYMKKFCKEKAEITEIYDERIGLNFENELLNNSVYCFSKDMIELADSAKAYVKVVSVSDKFNEIFSQIKPTVLTDEKREKLVSDIDSLLTEYEYHQKGAALNKIVNTWFENKQNIISIFELHPNYNGNYQIVFEQEYERKIDRGVLADVMYGFYKICRDEYIYKDNLTDEENKKMEKLYYLFCWLCDHTSEIQSILTEELAEKINKRYEDAHARAGQKFSKVIGKIARESGLNKKPDYNTLYPRLGDAINPLHFNRKTVLSVNPIDYYTMSFGDTWQSCHTIDKTNKRRNNGEGYQGCYSSGTESYMLDSVSFVFYTINEELSQNKNKAPELCDKAQRCMFHLGEDKLIQGRVYPQGTDGASEIYKQVREVVQKVISECFNIPNYWKNEKGTCECNRVTNSEGTHYRDYYNFSDCNVSYVKNDFKKNVRKITIGHMPICPCCGNEHGEQKTIECKNCYEDKVVCNCCGRTIDRRSANIIEDEYYCDVCSFYCEYCEEWHTGEYRYVLKYGRVCLYELNNSGDFVRCARCGEWIRKEDALVTKDGIYFCDLECARSRGYYVNDDGILKRKSRREIIRAKADS